MKEYEASGGGQKEKKEKVEKAEKSEKADKKKPDSKKEVVKPTSAPNYKSKEYISEEESSSDEDTKVK